MVDLMRFKTMHWNIQQAAGSSGEPILEIVIEEIIRKNADIGCITEYYSQATNAREFEKRLENLGYSVYTTNSPEDQNDVLIYVRDCFRSKQVMEFIWNERNAYPNYLEVLVEGEGFSFSKLNSRFRKDPRRM
ncbi:hypothetical protein [Clostridium sporogenes]|uniref:hypothetical protein n=1 Tax=Clostridium sporogenes TaxID=1509 RepID=UPI003DA2091D